MNISFPVPFFVGLVSFRHRRRLILYSLLLPLLCGCRSAGRQWSAAVADFEQGRPQAALERVSSSGKEAKAADAMATIDRAILALASGQPQAAEATLLKVRPQLDYLAQSDLTEQTKSVLTDDQARAWSGREFERRMVDNLAVLASLTGSRVDAFAIASQSMEPVYEDLNVLLPDPALRTRVMVADFERAESNSDSAIQQIQLAANEATSGPAVAGPTPTLSAPARFGPNALAAYLHAIVASESPLNSNLVQRDLRQMNYWSPDASINAELGTQTQAGHGTLHVITCCGRITDWTAEAAAPTSASLLLADQILSAVGDHSLPPTIAPVQIARPVDRLSPFASRTVVRVTGRPQLPQTISQVVVDLNAAAWDSYSADRDQQIARAVARRIVKKGAVYATKDQLAVAGGSEVDVLLNVGGIIWEALEKPDVRHLRCLPAHVEAAQLELPVGLHEIDLLTSTRDGRPSQREAQAVRTSVRIEDGRNTVLLCFRPAQDASVLLLANPSNE